MVMDITKREQLEQKLRNRSDLLAGIIASAMDAIIATDDEQRIVLFNAAAERMFTCRADEAIGASIDRFIPQRFRAEHSRHVRRFGETGVASRDMGALGILWGLRSNGEEFPIEAAISKVETGGTKFFAVVIRDLTERHRAEETLRESEQRFRLVADTAPVLIWMSGTDKCCTYFNKTWLDFTGRSLESELGNGWLEGVYSDDFQRCLDTYTQSFDRRENFRMEYRLRHHDGEYRWILDVGVPRFTEHGSFAGYIGICVDDNDRKRAQEAAFRHTAIVESSEDAIIATDVSGKVTDWNSSAERLFGYFSSEAIGKEISFLSPADHLEEPPDILKKVMHGEAVKHYETVRRRKDGTRVDISLTVSPIVDAAGKVVGASGIARDITCQKMSEETLRASVERLRLAQNVARIGSFEWNIQTGENIWTPELEAMYGLSPGSFGRTLKAFENLVHPDDRARVLHLIDACLKSRRAEDGEWRAVWPDGSVHWLAGRSQLFTDELGEPLRLIGAITDVTERKQAEGALLAMNRRMIEAQEHERARIGRELHDDINQRLALAVIELEQWGKEHFTFEGKVHERIRHVKQRLSDLGKDIQALSHRLHSSKLDYLGLTVAANSFCREFSEQQKVEIDFTHKGMPSGVPKEISLCLFRILQEALQNAVKYSGVRHFSVKFEGTPAEIQLTVSDHGIGFDQHNALSGQGLGLISMRERVQLVKGDLSITSQPDRGTTVCARVPFVSEDHRTDDAL